MSVQGKLDGTWSPARINLKYNNVWHEENTTWVKLNGTWLALIPEDVIIPYYTTSLPDEAIKCDGTDGTYNLMNRYAYNKLTATTPTLVAGKNKTHRIFDHPTGSTSIIPNFYVASAVNAQSVDNGGTISSTYIHDSGHSHIITAAVPLVSEPLDLSPLGIDCIPTIKGRFIEPNAILFRISSSVLASCTAFLKKYLRFKSATVGDISSGASHNHAATISMGTYTATQFVDPFNWDATGITYHTHTHASTVAAYATSEAAPKSTRKLWGNRVTARLYWSALEAGTAVLFYGTASNVPKGWTLDTSRNGYIRIDGNESLTNYHTHNTATNTFEEISSGSTDTSTVSSGTRRRIVNHTHTVGTIPITNSGFESYPDRVELRLIVKS